MQKVKVISFRLEEVGITHQKSDFLRNIHTNYQDTRNGE
jgi:hypothetical protein